MKRLTLLIFLFIPVLAFSQHTEYFYQFSLTGVKSISEAKVASEYIEGMFDVKPLFNTQTKQFEFSSPVNVPEDRFSMKVKNYGYHIIKFSKTVKPFKKE